MPTRLNKFIALALGISRREADTMVGQGKVRINNLPARIGQHVSASDDVRVGDKKLKTADYQYILLHKPSGYVCSRKQQGDTPTIYSLLPSDLSHLKPVGRLDKDSSGLLILTNDGDFAHRMTHPKFRKSKIYEIEIDKPLSEKDFRKITEIGVDIGELKLSKFQLVARHQSSVISKTTIQEPSDWRLGTKDWSVTLREGRNRQIRRTFSALGYEVIRLHRTAFGNFSLAKYPLDAGKWQELPPQTHLL